MKIRNVHERYLPADAPVGALIDGLATRNDPLWPWEKWPRMRFDRPLEPGADGGHGPVRYEVAEYEPGRRIRFAPIKAPRGLSGYHEFQVVRHNGSVALRHVIDGELRGVGYVKWPLVFRPFHDALIEDALDKAERAATGTVSKPNRWSPWVRFLRRCFLATNRGARAARRAA